MKLLLALAALLLPTVGALLALAVEGEVAILPAAAGAALAVAGAVGVVRAHRAELARAAAYVRRLAEAEPAAPVPVPEGGSPEARSLNAALARLHRAWRRRHETLAAQLDASERMLDALHDPFVLLDARRRVVRANQAARELFGGRLAGRDLAAGLRNPDVLAAVDAVLAGKASRNLEFTLPVPVERVFQARIKRFRPEARDAEDVPETSVILTLHDITAIKRMEQTRADFVANASHELRTPLATLLGFVETLRGPARDDPEARDRFLSIMQDQASRMSRLVDDLLSLSRIEIDEHTAPTGEADLAEILDDVVAGLEMKAAKRRIRLRLDLPPGLPRVVGDEDQLAQVFQNLIENAIKYGREGTEVTIAASGGAQASGPGPAAGSALANVPTLANVAALPAGMRRAGAIVAVSVTDRGEGIARIHLPRLTERFYRADAARSRAMGGTGLGLAIVKHIVNRHRGRLAIESEVGKGSTFTVHLPAAAAADAARDVIKP
ncbi:ATP-binding protein [Arenibaculum sp.]|uniref:ATP-binding protein n=1 Tax=Arenibaculum sp. TaxID=2865862 RepID=UPI002E13DB79|nr:ATP-binding protein [Arenibaculum sp.]